MTAAMIACAVVVVACVAFVVGLAIAEHRAQNERLRFWGLDPRDF